MAKTQEEMRKVIGIGETVLDIIFKNGQPVSATPGGSTFNATISLGRSGVDVIFIGETGDDRIGRDIVDFLEANGVRSDCVSKFGGTRSPLSLAFLDDRNDAEYMFYRDHSRNRVEFTMPDINANDIILFGSFYAVNPVIRDQVTALLKTAQSHDAIIYYDINYRQAHKDDLLKITANMIENFEFADILRGSRDDFRVVYDTDDVETLYMSRLSFYLNNFICTDGGSEVTLFSKGNEKIVLQPTATDVVSTIGAGDNFNAGVLFGLIANNISKADLDKGLSAEQWRDIIDSGMVFAAESCKSMDNYVSKEFGDKIKILPPKI